MSHTIKKIASNTFYQLAGKVVSMSITILATVLLTRAYGRDGYGEFNLMQNLPALFFIITDFGFNALAIREISKDWSHAQKYFSNILSLRLLLSGLFFVGLLIGLYFFPYSASLRFGIQIGSLVIFTQALYSTTNIIFQSKLKYDYSTIGYIAGSLVVLIGVLVLTHFKADIAWVNFTYVLGGILTFFVNVSYLKKLNIKLSLAFDKNLIKNLLITSLPLGLMFVFSQINFKADSIMLSVMKTPAWLRLTNNEVVALYGLPYKVFEVALVFPTFIMNSVYPVFLDEHLKGKSAMLKMLKKTMGSLIGLGSLVSVLGYFFAPFVIQILAGKEFNLSVDVLRILLSGIFIFFMTQPLSWLIVTLGKQIYLPFVYLLGAVFNVVANYLFIPKYSFYSSAIITIASEGFILILLCLSAYLAWRQKYAAVA